MNVGFRIRKPRWWESNPHFSVVTINQAPRKTKSCFRIVAIGLTQAFSQVLPKVILANHCQWMALDDNGWSKILRTFLVLSEGRSMSITAPHYLLFSDTQGDHSSLAGGWGFVLERTDGTDRIEIADREPDVRGERLKLLAVVRGLEALEQPAKVTIITPSRFIGRGIRAGLAEWKENHWRWERFGVMTDVKNADLWKRVDRARSIHEVDCRVWNFSRYFENRLGRSDSFRLPRSGRPIIKHYKHHVSHNHDRPSWTELAASLANRIISLPEPRAYSCA